MRLNITRLQYQHRRLGDKTYMNFYKLKNFPEELCNCYKLKGYPDMLLSPRANMNEYGY